MKHPLEQIHFVQGLAPVADALSGTVSSDVVNCKNCNKVVFLVNVGVGATGTSTITVEACDDVTPTTTAAIPFRYRQITTNDAVTALTDAAAAGFATTAGSAKMVLVEADVADMASLGYQYMRLTSVEVVDSPVLAGITVMLTDLRSSLETGDTFIV